MSLFSHSSIVGAPSSNPISPGAAPVKRETALLSLNSLIRSTAGSALTPPSQRASTRVSSVLPRPVPPVNSRTPAGRDGSLTPSSRSRQTFATALTGAS